MSHARFQHLLARFHAGLLKEEERQEFARLLETGEHDETLAQWHDAEWDSSWDDTADTPDAFNEQVLEEKKMAVARHFFQHTSQPHTTQVKPLYQKSKRAALWVWMSAAAAVLIITLLIGWLSVVSTPDPITQNDPLKHNTYTGRQYITLPDHTTIYLNVGSTLSFDFDDHQRLVTLKGEAYFDVMHDEAHPFIVRTGDIKTTVLGTAFNIKAFPETQDIVVTVTRGKVAVGNNEKELEQLRPHEQLAIRTDGNEIQFAKTNPREEALAWKDEFLILQEVSMAEAAHTIGKRFNTSIIIKNPALKGCKVQGTFFNSDGLDHIIATLCRVVDATYTAENGVVTINGGIGCDDERDDPA